MDTNMFENIECKDCPMDHGKRCPKPECKHCLEHMAQTTAELVALPYSYVDVYPDASKMRSQDEATKMEEAHLLRSITSKGQVVTRVQTAIPNHHAATPLTGSKFTIDIEGNEYTGSVASGLITRDNTRNEVARTIANSRAQNAGSLTLWVPMPADSKARIFDQIDIALATDEHPEAVKYSISVPRNGEPISAGISDRKLRSFAERQLRLKGYNPATHSAYTAGHVRIIVDNAANTLKDIEIDMVEPAPLAQRVQEFVCDPLDIDAVTGLTAALEEHIGSQPKNAERVTEVFNTVNTHRKALEKHLLSSPGAEYKVTPTVNAAINEATDIMWEQVGFALSKKGRYLERMQKEKAASVVKSVQKDIVAQYAEVNKMKQSAKGLKRKYYLQKRKSIEAKMDALLDAGRSELTEMEQKDTDDSKAYTDLETAIVAASKAFAIAKKLKNEMKQEMQNTE